MPDSVQPHRWQPTRLPRPWDSPGKNTGVGCHFLLQCIKVKNESEVAQSYPTLSDPMDCSPPGSSVHGIFQARSIRSKNRVTKKLKKGKRPRTVYTLFSIECIGMCVCSAVSDSSQFPTPRDLPYPRIELTSSVSPELADGFFPTALLEKPQYRLLVQFSSVNKSCPTLWDPMNCSTPGLPVHHQLPEFTQTHVHRVGDTIQPFHPLSSPSPAPNPSQHQTLTRPNKIYQVSGAMQSLWNLHEPSALTNKYNLNTCHLNLGLSFSCPSILRAYWITKYASSSLNMSS